MSATETLHFCTLFDKNYMSRGIAMYQSLLAHEVNFHLYIFAFDDIAEIALDKMQLDKVTIISLHEFEDEALLKVKPTRTRGEYCWTGTSSTIWFCLQHFNLQNCTYLDADLYFFQSPRVLVNEMPADKHVMITEHRYTSYYDQSKVSGKYCVQFMYFDNSPESIAVLKHWRNQCLEWCFNRIEDGKFGDQKYLDTWTKEFDCVYELKNLGGGLAPWNIQQYDFIAQEEKLLGTERKSQHPFEAIFYHFHGLKFYDHGGFIYSPNTYALSQKIKSQFYEPYIKALAASKSLILKSNKAFDPHGSSSSKTYFKDKYLKGKFAYIKSNFIHRFLKA